MANSVQERFSLHTRWALNMVELICMSVLGVAYINACIEERKEEELRKKQEELDELKLKVFWYAVKNNMLYNDVVKLIEEKQLTLDDINKESEEHE